MQAGDPGYSAVEQHGFIAAPFDQSTSIVWWNASFLSTGALGATLGAGFANTSSIISSQGAGNYAANVCYELVLNGYSDWFLPSRDELNKLYINRVLIGGLNGINYWSSSEVNATHVWGHTFPTGYQDNSYYKASTASVRAMRVF